MSSGWHVSLTPGCLWSRRSWMEEGVMDKTWRTEGTVSKNNWKGTSSLTHALHHHIFSPCCLILAPSRLFVFDASLRPVTPEKWEMTLHTAEV